MQRAGRLPFRYQRMGRWWGRTTVRRKDKTEVQETEIDLLAVSQKADQYLVGECKFKGRPFSFAEYLDTSAKLSQQKEKAEFFYYLFSESGFDDNLTAEAEKDEHLTLVGLEDVVNGI